MGRDTNPEALALYRAHEQIVERQARRLASTMGRSSVLDDLRAAGREGLWNAVTRFDPERGVPFAQYAHFRVRGAMLDAARSASRLPRLVHRRISGLQTAAEYGEAAVSPESGTAPGRSASAEEADRHLSEHLAGMATAMTLGLVREGGRPDDVGASVLDTEADPEEALAMAELRATLRKAVALLPDPERTLIERFHFAGEPLDDVACSLGMSKSWASRIHTRSISRLAQELRAATEPPGETSPLPEFARRC